MSVFLSALFHEILIMLQMLIIGFMTLYVVGWVKILFDKLMESVSK